MAFARPLGIMRLSDAIRVLERMNTAVSNSQIYTEKAIRAARRGCLQRALLQWWHAGGKRRFPWRDTQDPFKVLIAETLLHRTRADQVVPLYVGFLRRYTDIASIAQSSPDELAESFGSAGLHWRWKLLHSMANEIVAKFDGRIPDGWQDLMSLPGVGHYTASAVRCFAFGHRDLLLDTNTVRVAGRVFGLAVTDTSRRSAAFRSIIVEFACGACSRDFNLALIDLAAGICGARAPRHDVCPISKHCVFHVVSRLETDGFADYSQTIARTRMHRLGETNA